MNHSGEVLRQKEIELARLRRDIDALKLIIPLLVTDGEDTDRAPEAGDALSPAAEGVRETQEQAPGRELIAKSPGDIQSLAKRLRTKWAKVKREKRAA